VSGTDGRATHGSPVYELDRVEKSYGQVQALRGVSLTLRAGEIHALLGDNGAGKSTLLKIASGAIAPDSGQLRLGGRAISVTSPKEVRGLGVETVYQDLALASDRSAAANVYVGRELLRPGLLGRLGILDRRAMNRHTRREFESLSVPVSDVTRPVRKLSGGQRQGVAIARAAIWADTVLLLDEPTAALGVRQRDAVQELMLALRERGLAILWVSHDVPTVLEVADRVTVLRLGEVAAARPAAEADVSWAVAAMVGG
jgi:simple sugar transport system ATP-binding protein